ncbi:ABC transporter ATP-binding protein [Actinomyces sp.]|uniref:ABC transporter ATP-binding protein n=1 Tax=Actinomyces sp. TaxID=29317 RepID=UPI0026DB4928|nr:ABC transporter ATP-binding protein [Actinomyces sp.]MDO4901764.1 ABC transporter ATP-binding protein [Actinomyces sp.]
MTASVPDGPTSPEARHLSTSSTAPRRETRMSRRRPDRLVAHGPVGDPVVTARNLSRVFGDPESAVTALDSVDAHIARGRFTAVLGPSGSGKTTLMRCLCGLDTPTSGTVILDGNEISLMNQRQLTQLRRDRVGLILRSHNLIPSLSVTENITLTQNLARRPVDPARLQRIADVVGLRGRLDYRPAELTPELAQRVACARAIIGDPAAVFADEPAGSLGSAGTSQLLGILRAAVDELEQTVIVFTHDADTAARADTVLFLQDGNVVAEMNQPDRNRLLDALRDLGDKGASTVGVGSAEREVSQIEEAWSQPIGQQRRRPRSDGPHDWDAAGDQPARPARGSRAYDADPHDWDAAGDQPARPGRRSRNASADIADLNNPWGYR